jgi:hypothetical protein
VRRAHTTEGLWRIAVLVTSVMVVGVACTMFQSSDRKEQPQRLVGEPPEQESPFAYQGRPGETSRVETSGRLKDDRPDAGGSEADAGTTGSEGPAGDQNGVSTSGTESAPATSEQMPEPPDQKQRDPGDYRCFSCVRICPTAEASCEAGQRDTICGWGVHARKDAARSLAKAECSGALERERGRGEWDKITGECPPADCREPAVK